MNNQTFLTRIAAISAIVSAPLALGASIILVMSLSDHPEVIADPVQMISLGSEFDNTFRVVEFVGMFGYYLLLVPLIIYLRNWLRSENANLIDMYSILGLAGIFIGAIGSSILITAIPPMIDAYANVTDANSETLFIAFESLMNTAIVGLFGLSYILTGIWRLGISGRLQEHYRLVGIATIIVGIVEVAEGVFEMLQINALLPVLEVLTLLGPIWALWIGIVILRGAGQRDQQST